jgi:hypothetical protein
LREGNECVDWLTKFGTIIVETLKIWISPLAQLDIIMLTDRGPCSLGNKLASFLLLLSFDRKKDNDLPNEITIELRK